MVDAGVVASVERDHGFGDALADQSRIRVRVAHSVAVDHHDVGGSGFVPHLVRERLDEPAVGRGGAGNPVADRWYGGKRLGHRQRSLAVIALELRALVERDQHESHNGAGEQDPDHTGQDPG
jgi:hypothetical protein